VALKVIPSMISIPLALYSMKMYQLKLNKTSKIRPGIMRKTNPSITAVIVRKKKGRLAKKEKFDNDTVTTDVTPSL